MTKPNITDARWAELANGTAAANLEAPPAAQRDTGWVRGQAAISKFDNWQKREFYRWLKYLDSVLPMPARDGPGQVYVPESALDFQALGLPVPDLLVGCQDPSGDLVPAIGMLTGINNGTRVYRASLAGWTRKFVGTTESVNDYFGWTSPIIRADESYAMVQLIAVQRPPDVRYLQYADGLQNVPMRADGTLRAWFGAYGDGTIAHGDVGAPATVFPYVVYRNCAVGENALLTDREKIVAPYNAAMVSGEWRFIGQGNPLYTTTLRVGWVALYRGTNAERDWKAYLTALGWPLSY